MYKYLNLNPKGKLTKDCVKRAIAKVTDIDYMEVQKQLNRYKKVTGARKFNSDRNCDEYVENELKMNKMSFPAIRGSKRMNGDTFCSEYPKGRFILRMANHWTACVDGVIYDTWDCSEKCVYNAWEYIPNNETPEKKIVKRKRFIL